MKDYIIRITAANDKVRGFFATTKEMVEVARQIHDTTPVATAALGRTMTAASIMGIMLKNDDDIVTIHIKGDGLLKGIVVTADSKANVKGYVYQPHVDLPLNANGKLDVGRAIGEGSLSVLKDIGLKEPYTGQVPLQTGEIAEDLSYYFAKSEQIPTVVGLGVLVDRDISVKQSGGFIIQLMPNAGEEVRNVLETKLKPIKGITQMLDEGMTPEDICDLILGELNPKILDKVYPQFYCNCSQDRVEKALISIGLKDLEEILKKDKKATLQCHFCNKEYHFDESSLESIISSLKQNS